MAFRGGGEGGGFYTRLAAGQDVPAVTSASSEVLGLCPGDEASMSLQDSLPL